MNLKSNYLTTAEDIQHVLEIPTLSVLDIQCNRITDVEIVDMLANMPNLKVLYLQVKQHKEPYKKPYINLHFLGQ